jgi:predicted nuclease of predicted toxin-antitoxin system
VRWLVDECVDAGLVSHLRSTGHDVVYMAETAPRAGDGEVMTRAQAEGRILLTDDKDFGDLVFRRGLPVPGIILLRIDPAMHGLKQAWRRHRAIWRKSIWPVHDRRGIKISVTAAADVVDSRCEPQRFCYRKASSKIALEYIDAGSPHRTSSRSATCPLGWSHVIGTRKSLRARWFENLGNRSTY